MKAEQVVSIIVLCFNNFQYLFEAIDSILCQTYSRIQLVISDDASKSFNEKKIRRYLLKHKRENIVDFVINQNKENLGTVAHLKYARSFCRGELLTSIAADDAYATPDAIKMLVDEYNSYDGEVPFITSLAVMSDEKLQKRCGVFTSQDDIQLINSGDTRKLFEELSYRCIMSASGTLVHKSLYDLLGSFDDYSFVEDWSMHLRLARMGVKMKCLEQITYLHRDGGVSHGNKRAKNTVFLRYYRDLLTLYEKEVEPYLDIMSKYAAARASQYYSDRCKRYEIERKSYNSVLEKPKIVFFCRKGVAAKGDFSLYYRIASYIAEHYDYEVFCVNNSVSQLQEKYLDSKIHFCDINSENIMLFENATFIFGLNQLFCLIDEISKLKNAKIVMLYLHPEIVDWLLRQTFRKTFNFKKFSKLCIHNHAFAFQDEANYIAYREQDGYPVHNVPYFPVITDEDNLQKEIMPVHNKKVVNIAWLGRIDKDKVYSIVNCLDNLKMGIEDKEIFFHLIGDGDGKGAIQISKYAPKIKIVFLSFLYGEERDRYLRENVDIVVAMGMSALDAAVLGIPTVLPIVSLTPFKSNKFLYLFNTRNYCIGWKEQDLDSVSCKVDTIEDIVYEVYDDDRKEEYGQKCRDYITDNFVIERNAQNVIDIVEHNTLTKKKLMNNLSVRIHWTMFKVYQFLLHPGIEYPQFVLFKQKVAALKNKPKKEILLIAFDRIKRAFKERKK